MNKSGSLTVVNNDDGPKKKKYLKTSKKCYARKGRSMVAATAAAEGVVMECLRGFPLSSNGMGDGV